ncbi:hypothetical protein WCT87_07100 [Pectobacterium brasiliense]|uniref:hypothetical protein n=1 Tax=Pectobacterium brasiliense TaxID=180957 RepID=UPI00301700EB
MGSKLPENVARTLISDPAFALILERCLEEEEFIEQFERLSGVTRPRTPSDPLIAMVDKVTGYADDQWRNFFSEFIPFVHRCVYEPLLAQYSNQRE